jgi:predicted alpha-1,2-mannosidase
MKKKIILCLAAIAVVLSGFVYQVPKTPADYVNPFIGTGGHGHTYPGVVLPFGMVQLSPDTRLEGWDGCSGYHYSDSVVYGFSHTHLSGTGCEDYGDILVMPTVGEVLTNNGANGKPGYCSPFSHKNETAQTGYYSVLLDKYKVKAELTATLRVGLHQYTFPQSNESNIIFDLKHRDAVIASSLKIIGDNEIEGFRISKAWASNQPIYFVAQFSKAFANSGIAVDETKRAGIKEATGKNVKAWLTFATAQNEKILVRVGISSVSIEGARRNLKAELQNWDFDKVRTAAKAAWNKELSKVQVEGGTEDQKTVFYSALYHCFTSPYLAMDVDGQYLGRDLGAHTAKGFTNYSVFSLWDTYRGLHPLLNILQTKRTNDFINTFLVQYEQGGLLPVWELSGNETNCMIGYHAVPVIVDAYLKGIRGFDAEKALKAMKTSAMHDQFGLKYLKKYGFIPSDMEVESVSRTLEYAYDDWCIAQFAKALGKTDDYQYFMKRAQNYKNVFDPTTGFMRARKNGAWFSPFRADEVNFNFTEANSWQYSFAVQQDIVGLMNLLGGKEKMAAKLDEIFSVSSKTTGREQSDITGLIGQYAHGNEPSHHIAYLYNSVGKPWKTAEVVSKIMKEFYTNSPDGLIGNEDCGQMSAWAVLSAMGFYSASPGTDYYHVGTPSFPKVSLSLENSKKLVIIAKNLSDKNIYVKSLLINKKSLSRSFIRHQEIMNGGEIVFEMSDKPSDNWGIGDQNEPRTAINEYAIVPAPYVSAGKPTFGSYQKVALAGCEDARIFYTLDGTEPTLNSTEYKDSILITGSTKLRFVAIKKGYPASVVVDAAFNKIDESRTVRLFTPFAKQYAANGPKTLVDGIRGGNDFRLGTWQGYYGEDLEAIVSLDKEISLKHFAAGFLQDINSWIFMPEDVEFFISTNGKDYTSIGLIKNDIPQDKVGSIIKDFELTVPPVKAKYVKVVGRNIKACPPSHKAPGDKTWIFVDEIITE